MAFKTPVLLLIFNRPGPLTSVMEVLQKIQPAFLYIAADGPRKSKPEDAAKCAAARQVAEDHINWNCQVKKLYNDENKGCGKSVSEAITWFFDNVEQGIILEDDVLPSLSFFRFCEELLEKYKDETRVMSISGSNFIKENDVKQSYYFSKYIGIWGWATWRRAWKGYDYKISDWRYKKFKKNNTGYFEKFQFEYFKKLFNDTHKNDPNTWDYQWWYNILYKDGINITPQKNLTKNLGFSSEATHTFDGPSELKNMIINEIEFPLTHPANITVNSLFDKKVGMKYYSN